MESIRAENVVKSFGQTKALNGVTLEILPGELFFLLGASGCGKSTLLRCIAGLETPNSGKIFFGDRDVTALAPHKREAAMVFQSYALWPHLTVSKNISFGLEERKVPKEEIKRRVDEALSMVKLEGYGDRSIDAMSGGQQQRTHLAQVLARRAEVLLLDEPTAGLDLNGRKAVAELIATERARGVTVVLATHELADAESANLVMLLAQRVVSLGAPAEALRDVYLRECFGFTQPH